MTLKPFYLPYYLTVFYVFVISYVFLNNGFMEASDRQLIRLTAEISIVLFLLTFIAGSFYKIFPNPISKLLLQSRRYFGISFAISHTFHLLFILILQFVFNAQNFEERGFVVVFGGAIAYAFMYAMAFTSNNRMIRKMGVANWKRLHTIGSYYIFFIFCVGYIPRAFTDVFYVPFALMLTGAISMKLITKILNKKNNEYAN